MKLTKAMREEFVNGVMDGIPVNHHFDINDTKSEIINVIEAQLPSDLLKIVREYPNLMRRSKYINTQLIITKDDGYMYQVAVYVVDHEACVAINVDKWQEAYRLYEIEQEERNKLRRRLIEIANSCTTLAKLKVALPELESYMPNEVTEKQVPVAAGSVITDLINSGLKIPK